MIEIVVFRKKGGVVAFEVSGHANYAKKGSDIVCAAVSVLAQTAVGAMQEIVGDCEYEIKQDGYLRCAIPGNIGEQLKEKAQLILETMVIGFYQIEMEYKKFVSIRVKEVL